MTNRLISAKNVCFDFVPPYDFTASFLASRASRRGERITAEGGKNPQLPVWWALIENARTYFEQNANVDF